MSCDQDCVTMSFTAYGTRSTEHSCSDMLPVLDDTVDNVCAGNSDKCFHHKDVDNDGIKLSNLHICCCSGEL